MRKFIQRAITILICMNVLTIPARAQETSGFDAMLSNVFNGNNQGIIVEMNGEDITEQFITDFQDEYETGNLEFIKEYSADNYVMYRLPNTIQTRGISTGTYTTPKFYVVLTRTSQLHGGTITLPALFRFRITCTYDFNTGKISGSMRTPTVLLEDTEGVADEIRTTNVTYTGTITNNGYSVKYNTVSFTPQAFGSLDNLGTWQTYNRYTWSGSVTYTPAS